MIIFFDHPRFHASHLMDYNAEDRRLNGTMLKLDLDIVFYVEFI